MSRQIQRRSSKKVIKSLQRSSGYACETLEARTLLALIVPALHSLPGAPATFYLNFAGQPSFVWDGGRIAHGAGSTDNPIPAFSTDADFSNFSALDLQEIQNIWAVAAEKLSPFNIDVTTVDPGNRTNGKTLLDIIGGANSDWYGTGGGVSSVGSFTDPNLQNTVFAWPTGLNYSAANLKSDEIYLGTDIAHEAGHAFGLNHQRNPNPPGTSPPINEYYDGNGSISPIMGNSGNDEGSISAIRGIWWKTNMDGLQNSPDAIQDDLAVITSASNGFSYRPLDHYYANPFSITLLTSDSNGRLSTGTGVIVHPSDVAPFEFQATGSNGTFTINNSPNGGMLQPYLGLVDASTMTNVSAITVEGSGTATLTTSSLSPGHYYYIEARSAGNYGDIGQYTITGTLQTFAYLSSNTLNVIGFGNTNNNISIVLNTGISGTDPLHYTITDTDLGGTSTQTFLASQVIFINVSLGSGNDIVNFGGGNGFYFRTLSSMPVNSISMGAGNDSLIVDDYDGGAATYAVSTAYAGRSTAGVKEQAYFDSSVENVTLYTGGSVDTVSVFSTAVHTTIVTHSKTTMNIGDGGSAQTINGALTINSTGGTTVNVDDSLDPVARNFLLSTTGLLSLTPVAISWNVSGINGVIVSAGSGGNTIRCTGVPPLFGGAQNIINAGSGNDNIIMEFASGTLTVNGQGGNDTLTIDDSGFAVQYAYAIDYDSVSRTGLAVTCDPIETVNIDGSDGTDTFNVTATPTGSLNVTGGSGDDTVNFGTGLGVTNYGPATLNGGAGSNTVTVDDHLIPASFGFNANYAITATTLMDSSIAAGLLGSFSYSNFAALNVYAAADNHDFNVASTNSLTGYTLQHSGNGTNNLNLGSGNIGGILSAITFFPGGSTAAFNINDQASTTPRNYMFDGSIFNVPSQFAVFLGAGLKNLTLNGGNGNDSVTISGTSVSSIVTLNPGGGDDTTSITGASISSPITVNTGAGNDTVTVGSNAGNLSALASKVTVNGSTGNNQLVVNDRVNQNFLVASNSFIEKFGSGVGHEIDYSSLAGVTVNCGGGGTGNTVAINSTSNGTSLTINPGLALGVTVGGPGIPLTGIVSPITINGLGGSGSNANNLTLDDSSAANNVIAHINPTRIGATPGDNLFGAGGSVTYGGISSLTLNTTNASGGDAIYARPSATTSMTFNGGNPTTLPGDSLTLAVAGVTSPQLTPNGIGAGTYTFGNRMPVVYTGIEQTTQDAIAPALTNDGFQNNSNPNSLGFTFNDDVSASLSMTPAIVTDNPATTMVPYTVGNYDHLSNTLTLNLQGMLRDGNYRATIPAGTISDMAGNVSTGDYILDFFALTGDANHDRFVNTLDFVALAGNFGKVSGAGLSYSQGDFNYDGKVNALDFNALATMFGTHLLPAGSGPLVNSPTITTSKPFSTSPLAALFSNRAIGSPLASDVLGAATVGLDRKAGSRIESTPIDSLFE